MAGFGKPAIFNTNQGIQLTSPRFTAVLIDAGVKIFMDGRSRCMNSIFIKRRWRSLKYECIYLHAFEAGSEARAIISKWMIYYTAERPHLTYGGKTPVEVHESIGATTRAALGLSEQSLTQLPACQGNRDHAYTACARLANLPGMSECCAECMGKSGADHSE